MLTVDSTGLDIDAVLERFARDGYARLGVLLTSEGARRMAERATQLMTGDTATPRIFYQPAPASGAFADVEFGRGWIGPTLAYRKLERLENDPVFAAWFGNPVFESLARSALSTPIRLYRSVLWNKGPDGGMAVPWHQDDGAFWGLDSPPSFQIWTALDDAPRSAGCLEVVPGSHLGGLASSEGGTLLESTAQRADARAVALPAVRGECIVVHNHLWHRTGINHTSKPRRALSVSMLDGHTRCRRARRTPREFPVLFE